MDAFVTLASLAHLTKLQVGFGSSVVFDKHVDGQLQPLSLVQDLELWRIHSVRQDLSTICRIFPNVQKLKLGFEERVKVTLL